MKDASVQNHYSLFTTNYETHFFVVSRVIPEILRNPTKTPLGLTVSGAGAELDVDIAKFK